MEIYTLKSCDTCRKALKWLADNNIAASNFDIRETPVPADTLAAVIAGLGWEKVLNRRSTTWRTLPDADKNNITAEKAAALIAEHPTLMKRPLFITGTGPMVGFDKKVQETLLAG